MREFIKTIKTQYSEKERTVKSKQIRIKLLSAFSEFCNKYSLSWYADGGTLLGIVRDDDLISWDDDVDVVMPRYDYNIFCEIGRNNPNIFGQDIFFQTANTDCYFETFAKLRHNKSTVLTPREYNGKHNRGMFLDIFPLDKVPNDKMSQRKILDFVQVISKYTKHENASRNLTQCFNLLNDILLDIHEQNIESEYIANTAFFRYEKNPTILKANWYDDKISVDVYGTRVCIPVKYEQILTAWYGKTWRIPQQEIQHGWVDPFNDYHAYDGITKEEYEYLIN